ncbi:MAG TPA: flagellar basal-body rod protein FlgF [Pyrinomonadaceae bacterium]|nr:flagellar basal-body rod protein FlgF [Pyrinomonadaceae bacterium]
MNYGLYSIFLGMRARQNTLETQANNIANASTTGFKAQRMIYSTFEAEKKGSGDRQLLVAGASAASTTDFSGGSIQQTDRGLDIAIEGDAFLQVQTPRGIRYTRAGNMTVNDGGQLVTKNGDLVVGEKGPITIPRDSQLSIGQKGVLSAAGKDIDSLKLVRFNNPAAALAKDGESMFVATGAEAPQAATGSKIIQGSLEGSNINSVSEMVAMINNNREFESLQKSLTLLVNDMGRKISGEIGKL